MYSIRTYLRLLKNFWNCDAVHVVCLHFYREHLLPRVGLLEKHHAGRDRSGLHTKNASSRTKDWHGSGVLSFRDAHACRVLHGRKWQQAVPHRNLYREGCDIRRPRMNSCSARGLMFPQEKCQN